MSTLPLSFKAFENSPDALDAMRTNLRECAAHIHAVARKSGRDLHLGLEPEPLCAFETSAELIAFISDFDDEFRRVVGMNYDASTSPSNSRSPAKHSNSFAPLACALASSISVQPCG